MGKVTPLVGNINYVWRDASTSIDDIGDKNSSPISGDYSKVGFDIMFGNTREMVTYTGEIPSALGNTEGFERVPFIEVLQAQKSILELIFQKMLSQKISKN